MVLFTRGPARFDGGGALAGHLFVVPKASALPTGGNLYNEGLLAALASDGAAFERCAPEELYARADSWGALESVWLDSLYFDRLPALRALLPAARRRGLLLHALPSTLARAEGRVDAELLRHERAELAAFDCALVTSATAAEALAQLAPHLPAWVVEPAIFAAPPGLRGTSDPVRALVVANLTPNKGVLPWLGALAPRVRADDVFSLRHMGRLDLDPGYAEACLHKVRSTPALASRVAFDGVKTHAALLAELARAHVLISASRVESFGMAIADARASGCVVLARAGGHVERLVTVQAGGSVLGEDDALADTFLSCVRDRASLQERLRRASAQRLAARSWHEVAREFTRYLAASAWP